MDDSLTPPLYTSIITLPSGPDSPDAEAYAQALSTLPTYRRIDHGSSDHPVIHLGNGLWFFLFGTLASTSRPIPVTVEISDSTATIRPRSLTRTMIPQPQLANHQYRTAIDVRDALATVASTHPQMVTRMTPMRGEILRSWWLGLIVGLTITAALIVLYSIILSPLDPAILSVPITVMVVTYGIRYPFTRASSPSWTPQGEPEVLRLT